MILSECHLGQMQDGGFRRDESHACGMFTGKGIANLLLKNLSKKTQNAFGSFH